jgi:hypothetical protein
MRRVFSFGRRAIDGAVLFLALYAFCVVPIGKHTGLEHLRAILETRAAKDAGRELVDAALKLKDRLLDGTPETTPVHPRGTATLPKLPKHEHAAPANAALVPVLAAPASGRDAPDASLQ